MKIEHLSGAQRREEEKERKNYLRSLMVNA